MRPGKIKMAFSKRVRNEFNSPFGYDLDAGVGRIAMSCLFEASGGEMKIDQEC